MFTRFIRQQAENLTFTAVIGCNGCQFPLRSDKFNDPTSYDFVFRLSKAGGGQLWIEAPFGELQCPQHACNLPGRFLLRRAMGWRHSVPHSRSGFCAASTC